MQTHIAEPPSYTFFQISLSIGFLFCLISWLMFFRSGSFEKFFVIHLTDIIKEKSKHKNDGVILYTIKVYVFS